MTKRLIINISSKRRIKNFMINKKHMKTCPKYKQKKISIFIPNAKKTIYKIQNIEYGIQNNNIISSWFKWFIPNWTIPKYIYRKFKSIWEYLYIKYINKKPNKPKIFRWFKFDILKNDFEIRWKKNIHCKSEYNLRKILYEFEIEILRYKYSNKDEFMLVKKEIENFLYIKKKDFYSQKSS